jgi:hypothetical protein
MTCYKTCTASTFATPTQPTYLALKPAPERIPKEIVIVTTMTTPCQWESFVDNDGDYQLVNQG